MASTFWRGVAVDIESARAATKAMATPYATAANPVVITATAHGYTDGDYVYVTTTGMWQLNNRIVRVASKTTDNFQAEGVNGVGWTVPTAGDTYKLTFGTSLSTATNISVSGGEPEFADESTIHSTIRTRAPVLATPLSFSMESVWDPADAGLVALKAASESLSALGIRFTFSNGKKLVFEGYISCSLVPTGSFGELVKTPLTIESRGYPQSYAT